MECAHKMCKVEMILMCRADMAEILAKIEEDIGDKTSIGQVWSVWICVSTHMFKTTTHNV